MKTYLININTNTIELISFFQQIIQPDGSRKLIGMSKKTERDSKSGDIVSEITEPTGVVCFVPLGVNLSV